MSIDTILDEMIDIALSRKTPEETSLFSKLGLGSTAIRWGCIRVLEWLRAQSVSLRIRPWELKASSKLDASCVSLIEASDFLREVIQIKDAHLAFADDLGIDQARHMMRYAKENYVGEVHF
jgi:hypothetical protein